MGGFHCPASYKRLHRVTFGWTWKYFEGIHRSTLGLAMASTSIKERRGVLSGRYTPQVSHAPGEGGGDSTSIKKKKRKWNQSKYLYIPVQTWLSLFEWKMTFLFHPKSRLPNMPLLHTKVPNQKLSVGPFWLVSIWKFLPVYKNLQCPSIGIGNAQRRLSILKDWL